MPEAECGALRLSLGTAERWFALMRLTGNRPSPVASPFQVPCLEPPHFLSQTDLSAYFYLIPLSKVPCLSFCSTLKGTLIELHIHI